MSSSPSGEPTEHLSISKSSPCKSDNVSLDSLTHSSSVDYDTSSVFSCSMVKAVALDNVTLHNYGHLRLEMIF